MKPAGQRFRSERSDSVANQVFEVIDDVVWLEYQDIAFQRVEHHLGSVTHQRARESGPRHRADHCDDGLELVANARNQRIGRAFLDM